MIKVLFLCHGNICRSPMAEFILKDIAEKEGFADKIYVESAACGNEAEGRPVHRGTRRILDSRGIDYSGKKSTLFHRDDYPAFDYILTMDGNNKVCAERIAGGDPDKKIRGLLEFDGGGEVDDPWYTGDFETTEFDIERGIRGFIEYLKKRNKL